MAARVIELAVLSNTRMMLMLNLSYLIEEINILITLKSV